MTPPTDQDDRRWFEPLVYALERPAYQFTLMLTQNPATAEETLQEAFARVWASPNTPRSEPEFKRWLYRAISNLVRDQHRRRVIEAKLRFWSAPVPDPEDEVSRRFEDRELIDAVRHLGLKERQAVYLHYYEDQPFAEVAGILGMRENSARVLVHRALRKLRTRLNADPVVGEVPA
jgi:RNA polymerase sigma-70 factor (ECF subfamily)